MSITNPIYPKVDTHLEEIAKLQFRFPKPEGLGDFIRTCPFFENPQIKESRTANLVKYQPIGRGGTLFGYTGATSRVFNVSFSITLPLILQLGRGMPAEAAPSDRTKQEMMDMFFQNDPSMPLESQSVFDDQEGFFGFGFYRKNFFEQEMATRDDSAATKAQRERDPSFHKFFSEEGEKLKEMYGMSMGFPGMNRLSHSSMADPDAKNYRNALGLIVYWANLIRSSVLTYAPNPSVGPPIIRLWLGILYQDIATVASKYSITIDDKAGYDVISLLPRKINVTLQLHEVRTSASNAFEAGGWIGRDELRGWEAVVGRSTGDQDTRKEMYGPYRAARL